MATLGNYNKNVLESVTKVIKEGDSVYTYLNRVMVSCNGEETLTGKILRHADLDLDEDVNMEDEWSILLLYQSISLL